VARLFAAAADVIQAPHRQSQRFVWVHARGLYCPWDAPLELQESLLDEGDPPPLASAIPPDRMLTTDVHPDTAFRHTCAYAAQVIVLDACWNGLMEAVASTAGDHPWLVMLLGVRGFPLGEHGWIGGVDPRLYVEQLHVPWLVRFPNGRGALVRSQSLVSHLDLLPTLVESVDDGTDSAAECFDGKSVLPLATSARMPWRDWLLTASAGHSKSFRTPAWCLRQGTTAHRGDDAVDSPLESELYVRPDDRWEANDVAKLCPDVVEWLGQAMADVSQQLDRGQPLSTCILPADTSVEP
jgi:arylsulfatase A-like enzyme